MFIELSKMGFITQNWRGKPLISHEIIVNLIAATTTRNGLFVQCKHDTNKYPLGVKMSDEEVGLVGEWGWKVWISLDF